jgi:late competence protein required for DNA uptake (superfamily II DNA/RNA helicase)
MVVWSGDDVTSEVGEQVTSAMLAQWRALAEPKFILCDRCEAVVPEEETIGGDYCQRYCRACIETDAEPWSPEEWFAEGGDL